MAGKLLERAGRKRLTMSVFEKDYKAGLWIEKTSTQVARAQMLEPSGFIRDILAELVSEGLLDARKIPDERASNLKGENAFYVLYKLSQKSIDAIEAKARDITVNVGGKAITQIRMF